MLYPCFVKNPKKKRKEKKRKIHANNIYISKRKVFEKGGKDFLKVIDFQTVLGDWKENTHLNIKI